MEGAREQLASRGWPPSAARPPRRRRSGAARPLLAVGSPFSSAMSTPRTSWSRERSRSSARRSSTAQRFSRSASPGAEQGRQRPRLRHALAVIAGGLGDDRHLDRREARQAAVEDQVARVLVVVVVVDGHADVVQHAGRPQQLALAGVAVVQPEPGELVEHAERERGDVARCARRRRCSGPPGSARSRAAVLEQRARLAPRASRRSKNTPSRSPASVVSRPSKPPACSTPCTTTAPARIRSARAGLMPGIAAALGGGQRGQPLHQLVERLALDHHPLHAVGRQPRGALRGGGEVAHGPADADQAPRRPAAPARRPARARAATCSRSSSICLRLAGPFGGRKRSLIRTVPSAPRAGLAREPVGDTHQLQRAAAEIEHAAVAQRRRVDRREVAVARLLPRG